MKSIINTPAHILDEEEMEGYALLKNMLQDRKGDYVSDDEINEALNRKDMYRKFPG